MSTQLPVLQAAAALELSAVSATASSVVVEAIATDREIASYESILARHGVLSHVVKATLGIMRDQNGLWRD